MGNRIAVGRWSAVAALLGVLGLAAAPPAEAQRWGRPRTPQDGACFYQNADYGGDYFCVAAGEDVEQMPSGLNDRISSIRTFGDIEVTVFRNPGFGGRSSRFAGDVSNLQQQGWNDTLSSLSVRRLRGGRGVFGGGRQSGATADRIVRRAYQDLLGREPDESGLREFRRRIIEDGWTEADVREALRRSSEFRQQARPYGGRADGGTTRDRAQDIVRRAYLSVLGREPDPASEGYVNRVLRDNWSEEDVARELRKSPEYRNRRRPPA